MLKKNSKQKFSAKQLAAQKRFAAMAKAGKFRKRTKRNPRGSRHPERYILEKWNGEAIRGSYTTLNEARLAAEKIAQRTREAVSVIAPLHGENYDYRDYQTVTPQGQWSKWKDMPRKYTATKNPVKSGARRSPPKRNPSEKFLIRGQRPVKSGYLYYYLRGDQFVKDAKHADKFSNTAGEKQMRAILPKLPAAIASITLVKA